MQVLPRRVTKVTQPVLNIAIIDTAMACVLASQDVVCIWNDRCFKIKFVAGSFLFCSLRSAYSLSIVSRHMVFLLKSESFIAPLQLLKTHASPKLRVAMIPLRRSPRVAKYLRLRYPILPRRMFLAKKEHSLNRSEYGHCANNLVA